MCASTERELDRWLAELPDPEASLQHADLVVVARRQRFGHGQQGRVWVSPPGGLWLSAAMPWRAGLEHSAPLALAAAVGISRELERLGLAMQIKWPNDLMVRGFKIGGILPRLRLRGSRVRWAQVGVGLNGINPVPPGAISVGQALGLAHHPKASPKRLLPAVLRGLNWAQSQASKPEIVRLQAEQRLLRPAHGLLHQGQCWQVVGLTTDGGLRVECDGRRSTLRSQLAESA